MAKEHRWLSKLDDLENFLAVYDVLLDIKKEVALSRRDQVYVPIWQPLIRFEELYPWSQDAPGYRDTYCGQRWKAAQFLKLHGVITEIRLIEGDHRWESQLHILADETIVRQATEAMAAEHERRKKLGNAESLQLHATAMNANLDLVHQRVDYLESLAEEIEVLVRESTDILPQPQLSNKGQSWYQGAKSLLAQHGSSGTEEFDDLCNGLVYNNAAKKKLTAAGYPLKVFRADTPDEQAMEGFWRRLRTARSIVAALPSELRSRFEARNGMQPMGSNVFVGHGGAKDWLELEKFLKDSLNLTVDEFNAKSTPGVPTVVRLQEMLDASGFAFLVMTAEDEHQDKSHHARENVVHEAGLFQGRLGFKRAIILLEQGCTEFSNIRGLTHIPFPKGHIAVTFEQVRSVLKREGMIQ